MNGGFFSRITIDFSVEDPVSLYRIPETICGNPQCAQQKARLGNPVRADVKRIEDVTGPRPSQS